MDGGGLLDRTMIPDSRFPILGFRIPNSVWHMGILEYRTMRSRGRGGGRGRAGGSGYGDGGGDRTRDVLCQ